MKQRGAENNMLPKIFYIAPEELFRLGNSTNPKLSHIRQRDVNTIDINGINNDSCKQQRN